MIEIIKQQLRNDMPAEQKTNHVREILQLAALKILYDKGWFTNLSFVGGTALRILFDLKRFSEDLDFSLVKNDGYDFIKVTAQLEKEFGLMGLQMKTDPRTETNVHSTFMKFKGLLREVALSPLKDQVLSIKLEIDTNPPKGGVLKSTLVNKVYLFTAQHFDLPSMFATKLHACFYRRYTKGRDYYDLVWYLSKKVQPNFMLLQAAITQTQGQSPDFNQGNFKQYLLEHIKKVDFAAVKKDVARFLEDSHELSLLDGKVIRDTVEAYY